MAVRPLRSRTSASLLASSLLAAAALACSSSPPATGPGATADAGGGQGACPVGNGCANGAAAPSYQGSVQPVMQQYCLPCHSPGGSGPLDETSYANVYADRSPILDAVSGCVMPPSTAPQPSAAQRVLLIDWLECGAPNN